MNKEKPIAHVDFPLLGSQSDVVQYLAAFPEVRQLFQTGSKHNKKLNEMKDAPLIDRLSYVKQVADAFQLLFEGDDKAQGMINIVLEPGAVAPALDRYVIDAYLAEDNWQ